MKILCTACGQRFDDLLCGGVCPHCCRYNDPSAPPEGAPQAEPAAPVWQPPAPKRAGPAPRAAAPGRAPVYAAPSAARPRPARGSAAAAVLCALLVLALVAQLVAFPLAAKAARAAHNARGFVHGASTETALQGEAFSFGPLKRQVTVGRAERLPGLAGVQEGAEMVRVWCSAKEQSGYASWGAELYLQVGQAYYLPVSLYDLQEVYPQLAVDHLEDYELVYDSMAEGWVYFVAPQGAAATLWLQAESLDEEYRPSSVHMTGVEIAFEERSVEG